MAKILVYSEAGRSQIYPLVPALLKLADSGHRVIVKTGRHCVSTLRRVGLQTSPISDYVEFFRLDDWECETYEQALKKLIEYLIKRSRFDFNDFAAALRYDSPDLLIVNGSCLGAAAGAIASKIPVVTWHSDLVPFPASGIPLFGPGLPYSQSTFGAIKNWARSGSIQKCFECELDSFNDFLLKLGLLPLKDMQTWFAQLPNFLYFTSEAFEYPRPWPENVTLVGASHWEPELETKLDLPSDSRQVILVSLGCSYQNNAYLLKQAIAALPSNSYQIVATTCSIPAEEFAENDGAIVTRFASHNDILKRASCVICCGGLTLVQKALAHGVPVCLVPQVRSQLEVAQRVLDLNVGLSLDPKKLNPSILNSAVRKAIDKRRRVQEVSKFFSDANTTDRCLSVINRILALNGKL
ncbi:MAG: glycosyltransferase [Candidatus Bruticola sp.]